MCKEWSGNLEILVRFCSSFFLYVYEMDTVGPRVCLSLWSSELEQAVLSYEPGNALCSFLLGMNELPQQR